MSPKNPRYRQAPEGGKRAGFVTADPASIDSQHASWRFDLMDMGGEWSWQLISAHQLQVLQKGLAALESLTWRELHANKNFGLKSIPVEDLPSPAFRRLRELNLEDLDRLYEIRLASAPRIWAVKEGAVLRLLWYDPNHTVWKMNIKDN